MITCYDNMISSQEKLIAEFGTQIISTVDEAGRNFTYTIGFQDKGWPELIIYGLRPEYACMIMNDAYKAYSELGRPPFIGEINSDLANLPMNFGTVTRNNINKHLCQAVYRAEREKLPEITALQIVMPDREGRFPSDPRFDYEYMKPQLILSEDV